jgi:chorismate-pyruvate lyase
MTRVGADSPRSRPWDLDAGEPSMQLTQDRRQIDAGMGLAGQRLMDLFIAQGQKPEHLSEVDLGTLSPLHRVWLALDGTVTRFFEAYTLEPIRVVRLLQRDQYLMGDDPWLEAPKGEAVVARQVLLQGEHSRRLRVYAASLILPARLPAMVRKDLSIDGEGLGRILLKRRVEQSRELLWHGKENVADLPEALREYRETEFLSRTYRIVVAGRPIALITEKCPLIDVGDPTGPSPA